jgi:hypothetical protein
MKTTTTTKNEARIESTAPTGHTPEELRTALEVHTLAQMLYGQIAVAHPWIAYHDPMMGQTTFPVPPAWSGPWVQPYAAGPVAGWWR